MANRTSNHPAAVAATESDTNNGLIRIIELSAKWQEPSSWRKVLEAAKEYRFHRAELFDLDSKIGLESERRLLARLRSCSEDEADLLHNLPVWSDGDYEKMQADARSFGLKHKELLEQVVESYEELIELKNLVRQHTPRLLECVPDADFGVCAGSDWKRLADVPEMDHAPLRCDLRKLEEQVRVLLAGKTLGGDNPTENQKEIHYPFGMKVDARSRVVSRFNKGMGKDSICTIGNDDQWNLLMLVVKNNGVVPAERVRTLLPIEFERNNARTRLVQKLNDIQLTLVHKAGTGYALKEFPG